MGESTSIAWCDHTFNPWWGCTRVSPGCEHCYAEAFAKRTGLGWGPRAERRLFGEKHWTEPVKWNRLALRDGVRRRVFCASMADVLEDRPELDAERLKLWALIDVTPSLDWLLLTKRPENWRRLVPPSWLTAPRPNVWALTTAEDQERADRRIPELLQIPAVVHGVSYEPALGPVDFSLPKRRYRSAAACALLGAVTDGLVDGGALHSRLPESIWTDPIHGGRVEAGIDWLIVGGESGPGARPFDLSWARSAVAQCKAAAVPVFVKQLGARPRDTHYQATPLSPVTWRDGGLRDRKGGDPSEWPEDLRVREFPTTQELTR